MCKPNCQPCLFFTGKCWSVTFDLASFPGGVGDLGTRLPLTPLTSIFAACESSSVPATPVWQKTMYIQWHSYCNINNAWSIFTIASHGSWILMHYTVIVHGSARDFWEWNEITHSLVQNLSDQWLATFNYGYPSSSQWIFCHIIREGHKIRLSKFIVPSNCITVCWNNLEVQGASKTCIVYTKCSWSHFLLVGSSVLPSYK